MIISKHHVLIFLGTVLSITSSKGQIEYVEVKAGVFFPSMANLSNEFENVEFYHRETFYPGFYVGIHPIFNLEDKWFFEIGLEFSSSRFKDNAQYYYFEPYLSYHSYLGEIYRKINVDGYLSNLKLELMLKHIFSEKFGLSFGLVPAFLIASNAKGTIRDSMNTFYVFPPEINGPVRGVNSKGVDAKFSIDYFLNKNLGINFSFQIGLIDFYYDNGKNVFDPDYANDYIGGTFRNFSAGIVYRLVPKRG